MTAAIAAALLLTAALSSRVLAGDPTAGDIQAAGAGTDAAAAVGEAAAETEKAPAKGPRIEFDHTAYDFGFIEPRPAIEHTIHFQNTGIAPLKIERVQSHCGCTTLDYPTDPIPPGGQGSFTLNVTPKGGGSYFSGTADVYSNDPENPKVLIQVNADVVGNFRLDPVRLDLLVMRLSSDPVLRSPTDTIRVLFARMEGETQPPFRTNVTARGNLSLGLDVGEARPEILKPSGSLIWEVPVVVRVNEDNAAGDSHSQLLFGLVPEATTMKVPPQKTLSVTARVRNHVDVIPETLPFGTINSSTDPVHWTTRDLLVKSLDGNPFKVTEIRVSDTTLKASLDTMGQALPEHRIQVAIPSDHAAGQVRSPIYIETDYDTDPVVQAIVWGFIR